jgi:hypothetical protein
MAEAAALASRSVPFDGIKSNANRPGGVRKDQKPDERGTLYEMDYRRLVTFSFPSFLEVTAMTKRDRIELEKVTAAAATAPEWAAATLAAMHRSAANGKDAATFESVAATLGLPVRYSNGCMLAI